MRERVTANDLKHVETKIIMEEDNMFRETNYYKKLEIRERESYVSEKEITENAVSETGELIKLSFLL